MFLIFKFVEGEDFYFLSLTSIVVLVSGVPEN